MVSSDHHHEDGTQSDSEDPVHKETVQPGPSSALTTPPCLDSTQSALVATPPAPMAPPPAPMALPSAHMALPPAHVAPPLDADPVKQEPFPQQAFIIEFFDENNPRKKRSMSFTHSPALSHVHSVRRSGFSLWGLVSLFPVQCRLSPEKGFSFSCRGSQFRVRPRLPSEPDSSGAEEIGPPLFTVTLSPTNPTGLVLSNGKGPRRRDAKTAPAPGSWSDHSAASAEGPNSPRNLLQSSSKIQVQTKGHQRETTSHLHRSRPPPSW